MRKNGLKKILVVDDDPADRVWLKKVLGNSYIIIEAEGGEEAISFAHSEKPDLVLMDVMMPKVDGYSACHRIKMDPHTAGIPVVMVTGLNYKLNMRLAEELDANGYVNKPVNPQELSDRIYQFLSSDK
jgi:CheY-like chemotaxis protein